MSMLFRINFTRCRYHLQLLTQAHTLSPVNFLNDKQFQIRNLDFTPVLKSEREKPPPPEAVKKLQEWNCK